MPHFPTRSNLMRSSHTADTPPICKSKDKIVGLITRCRCPDGDECETTSYTEIDFTEFMEIVDGETGNRGSWFWEGDEESDQDDGDWDDCTPTGHGTGHEANTLCYPPHSTRFIDRDNISYPDWINLIHSSSALEHGEGSWISSDTGHEFPTNFSDCV